MIRSICWQSRESERRMMLWKMSTWPCGPFWLFGMRPD
ncbi:putative gp48 [Burkholderia pseudomallei TSV5]|nr:putative gp48 [Burkholderia pseudomallei TSV5]